LKNKKIESMEVINEKGIKRIAKMGKCYQYLKEIKIHVVQQYGKTV
jgi:hypothetical protein